MLERPRSVIIDGIHYVPADAESTTELRLGLWRSKAKRSQVEVARLRAAIEEHQRTIAPGDDYCGADVILWRAIDA